MFIIDWWYRGITDQPGHLVTALSFLTIASAVWVMRELWYSHQRRKLEQLFRRDEKAKAWRDFKKAMYADLPLCSRQPCDCLESGNWQPDICKMNLPKALPPERSSGS